MTDTDDTLAEDILALVAENSDNISADATDYGVIALVVEEHEEDIDAVGAYKTNFRDDADDATASAFAAALSQTAPQLLLEMAAVEGMEE